MSRSAPTINALNFGNQPVRRAIRQLRWFKSSFLAQVNAVSDQTGITFETNTEVLARCFLAWLKPFESNKPDDPAKREAYVGFAAGLMLRQMIELKPLRHISSPEPADAADPAQYWPEGFVYVTYCLNVRRLVLNQEFDETLDTEPGIPDIGTWWSFKENVEEMSAYAMSFLDLFAGIEPDFESPGVFDRTLFPRALLRDQSALTRDDSAEKKEYPQLPAGHVDEALLVKQSSHSQAAAVGIGIGWQRSEVLVVDDDGDILFQQGIESGYRGEGVLDLHQMAALKKALAVFNNSSVAGLDDIRGNRKANTQSELEGLFVTVPDSTGSDHADLQAAMSSLASSKVWLLGAASAAAMAEITFGAGRSLRNFLLVYTDDMLEYRLVQNGHIRSGRLRENQSIGTRDPDLEQQALIQSIETLVELAGLQDVVLSPQQQSTAGIDYAALIGRKFPDLRVRCSEIEGSPLALCATCIQFIRVEKSGE